MKHSVLHVGKMREPHFRMGVEAYFDRLRPYAKVDLIEVPDRKTANRSEHRIIQETSEELEARVSKLGRGYWIALDERGRSFTSTQLAKFLHNRGVTGDSHLIWLIGGALGLSRELISRCSMRLSLSRLTFPHEMVPLILLEQLYRGHTILRGEPYHK